jgi:hypothetical protein
MSVPQSRLSERESPVSLESKRAPASPHRKPASVGHGVYPAAGVFLTFADRTRFGCFLLL